MAAWHPRAGDVRSSCSIPAFGEAMPPSSASSRKSVIAIVTEKTGTKVTIPMLPELARTLKAMKAAHGLGKSAAASAANRGTTVAELEAIFGWEGGRMASHYTKSADREALAAGAIKLARKKK